MTATTNDLQRELRGGSTRHRSGNEQFDRLGRKRRGYFEGGNPEKENRQLSDRSRPHKSF